MPRPRGAPRRQCAGPARRSSCAALALLAAEIPLPAKAQDIRVDVIGWNIGFVVAGAYSPATPPELEPNDIVTHNGAAYLVIRGAPVRWNRRAGRSARATDHVDDEDRRSYYSAANCAGTARVFNTHFSSPRAMAKLLRPVPTPQAGKVVPAVGQAVPFTAPGYLSIATSTGCRSSSGNVFGVPLDTNVGADGFIEPSTLDPPPMTLTVP